MSIQAVSSVKNNGYNSVNFTGNGKNEKTQATQLVSGSLKAVPLAVLIAMSPLNSTNAAERIEPNQNVIELAQVNNDNFYKVIEQKSFIINNDITNKGTVIFAEDKNGKKVFLFKAQEKDKSKEPEFWQVDGYNIINAELISSNGIKERNLNFPLISMSNGYDMFGARERTLSNKDVLNYIHNINLDYKEKTGEFIIPASIKNLKYSPDSHAAGLNFYEPVVKMTDVERDLGTKIKTIVKDFEGSYDKYTVNLRKLPDGRNIVSVSGEKMPELMLTAHNKTILFLDTDFDSVTSFGMEHMVFDYQCSLLDQKLGELLKQLSEKEEYSEYFPEHKFGIVHEVICHGGVYDWEQDLM